MPTSKPDPGTEAPLWTPADASSAQPDAMAGEATTAEPVAGPAASGPRRSAAVTGLLAVIALAATTGIGFAVGRATAPEAASNNAPMGQNGPRGGDAGTQWEPGQLGPIGDRIGRVGIGGTVTAVTADSITISLAGGNTVTFTTTAQTTYRSSGAASASDVTVGDSVTIVPAGGPGPRQGASQDRPTAARVTITSQ